MVDYIRLNKLLPSLSSSTKVKPVGQRQNHNRQNSPKQTYKERKKTKKKKIDPKYKATSDRDINAGNTYNFMNTDGNKAFKEPMSKRKIDIRV